MGLKNIRIGYFCCCCSLSTGTIIAAVLGWFLTTISILLYNEIEKYIDSYSGPIPRLLGNIIAELITFTLCIMLILAVLKRNVKVIFIVLIFKGIEILILCLLLLLLLLSIIFIPNKLFIILYMILACTLLLVFAFYFWLTIWSLYLQYNDENSEIYDVCYSTEDDKLNDLTLRTNC